MQTENNSAEPIALSIEQAMALYFDEDALRLPSVQMYRVDIGGNRCYYTVTYTEDGEPVIDFYAGVTTLIQATTPTGIGLIKYFMQKGEDADEYKEERATYGTIMHIIFEKIMKQYLQKSTFDFDSIPEITVAYFDEKEKELTTSIFNEFTRDLKQDAVGFVQFLIDTNFKPIAIEMPLACKRLKTAGTMDLFGTIEVDEYGDFGEVYKTTRAGHYKKGDVKLTKGKVEYHAIVDFKSGRKGTYTAHEIQLSFYEAAFKENFPEFADTPVKLYNLRPKDWRSSPGYILTDQTGKQSQRKLELLSELYYIDNQIGTSKKTVVSGVIDFSAPDLQGNYQTVTMEEIITNRHTNTQ
jgi:hypothetical protein